MASRNSLKSMNPFLSVSKVRKNMIAKFVGISGRKAFAVDLHESFGSELTIWTVTLEPTIPFNNGIFVKTGRGFEHFQVCFAQTIFGFFLSHLDFFSSDYFRFR